MRLTSGLPLHQWELRGMLKRLGDLNSSVI
ncbi:hypothetical protein LFAB_11020 [Lactiplantibacillus fabifermentans T30PCM01]|uniref:Uncharacterized protein n=1 Tax=Lactiplantibacillus fabifermentans T30PCM01 TaxID=1400520 RepID=W6TC38_9LACO|nr:hypothetical protein LFAB_11020 [Lactiplantibacillus fabifermentans T30PCM01]